MQHPEKAGAGLLPAQCGAGQGAWGAETLFLRKGGICGGDATPAPGNQKPNIWEGPREPKHLQAGGEEKQAPGQGREGRTAHNKTLCPHYRELRPFPNFPLLSGRLPQGRTEHLPPSNTESGSQPREGSETALPTLPAGRGTVPEQGAELGHRERALRSNWERQTGHLGLRHRQKLWAEVSWAWAAWPPPTWWLCREG